MAMSKSAMALSISPLANRSRPRSRYEMAEREVWALEIEAASKRKKITDRYKHRIVTSGQQPSIGLRLLKLHGLLAGVAPGADCFTRSNDKQTAGFSFRLI